MKLFVCAIVRYFLSVPTFQFSHCDGYLNARIHKAGCWIGVLITVESVGVEQMYFKRTRIPVAVVLAVVAVIASRLSHVSAQSDESQAYLASLVEQLTQAQTWHGVIQKNCQSFGTAQQTQKYRSYQECLADLEHAKAVLKNIQSRIDQEVARSSGQSAPGTPTAPGDVQDRSAGDGAQPFGRPNPAVPGGGGVPGGVPARDECIFGQC